MLLGFGLLIISLWYFDWYYDAVHASGTLPWRLSGSVLALLLMACTVRRYDPSLKGAVLYCGICAVETVYMRILQSLDQAYLFGMGGFLYFQLACVLLGLPFSLRLNLWGTLAVLFLPHLLGVAWFTGFDHIPYMVLVWPAGVICLFFHWGANGLILNGLDYRDKMEQDALLDPLTGLLNRRALEHDFEKGMQRMQRSGEPMSLILLDLDLFKRVNDTFGHKSGDRVLQALARIMKESFRASDSVARVGGEEFVCLLPGLSVGEAARRGEALRLQVESHAFTSEAGKSFPVTVSLGVTAAQAGENLATVLDRADKAMYRAKRGGRNQLQIEE